MLSKDAIQELSKAEAISAAAKSVAAQVKAGTLIALPGDFNVHTLEKFMPTRRRARGNMETNSISDFAKYIDANKEAGAAVFVHQESMSAVAVLNLGVPSAPGHADNHATLSSKKTAAYSALKSIATGIAHKQLTIAEFLEDWTSQIICSNDAGDITLPQAIAAIRKITIESAKKTETTEAKLSASHGVFESVTATSVEPLPTTILFTTAPYNQLAVRTFAIRLSVLTSGEKPAISLRIVNQEQHDEDMAAELASLVTAAVKEIPVLIGEYTARA